MRSAWVWAVLAILILPLVSDFVQWSLWRQNLQDRVDDSARNAAGALRRNRPLEPVVLATLRPHELRLAAPPAIELPPRSGYYRGLPNAVRIRVRAVRILFFTSRLWGPSVTNVEATAAIIPTHRAGETRAALLE